MEFDQSNFPMLPGANQEGRESVEISNDKLLAPLSGSAFAPRLNDEFEFSVVKNGKVYAEEQNIPGSTNTSVNIACIRNGKPSWIGLGHLTRIDANLTPVSDFAKTLRESYATVGELLEALKDKKIRVTSMPVKEFLRFGTTEKMSRPTAVFEFVK